MDILIPNMDKPKVCYSDQNYYCPFMCFAINSKGAYCMRTGRLVHENKLDKSCPLVALPEHGDLIDRSLLKGASYEIMRFPDDEAVRMFVEAINEAPTIVEASK